MSDYTMEANYKEFVAVLADQLQAHVPTVIATKFDGDADEYARVFTAALLTQSAHCEGAAVTAACKQLKLKRTYKAIREYLTGTFKVPAGSVLR